MSTLALLSLAALIPWQHPSLEIYRAGVQDHHGRLRIEFCVRPKEGISSGTTAVGYPRYETGWGRWNDGVISGIERGVPLRASTDTGPACFSVIVPPDAIAVELQLDRRAVEIPLEDAEPERIAAELRPTPGSEVDDDVAASLSTRPDALAVVLGVGAYAKAPPATYASADAKTAARYFEKLLGVPAPRIELVLDGDASFGQMQRIFGADGWLARRVRPDSEVFVFFAGHGMVDPETSSPYLLPADADPDYLRQTGLSMDRLIELVASLGARRTTVFLDACFTGLSREGAALLEDARPLFIERSRRVPAGLSIFSASSRGQVASSLDEQRHGLFSYYLFKGIAGGADLDHDRRILASEVESYLEEAVPRAAQSLDREQIPSIVLADPQEVLVQLP